MERIKLFILFYAVIFTLSLDSFGQTKNSPSILTESTRKDSVLFTPGKNYKAGKFKRFLFGAHYRKEWNTAVKAPVFDLRKEGLEVVKQGGSRQTVNLRLVDSTGREYVLRSIDKTPKKALPEELRETFIADILQDQVSTAHPYGALTIPILAEAAGVYHTHPELVYVPEDSAFAAFRDVLANSPALFEERPDGPMKDADHFGNPPNVIGTEKMWKKRFKDNDNQIDERLFARSRLFDMLVGDWSRHEDQWRWGAFPKDKGEVYKPIPRDRDHVYFKFKGLLPAMISRPWGIRHLRHFDYKIRDIRGLNESARNIDRMILSSLNEQDWVSIADSLQLAMTDKVIDSALRELPENVFEISGPEIISKLKCRREQLPKVAKKYYAILSKQVNIYGSDKHERLEVNRIDDKLTEVSVFKISKQGEIRKTIYHRIFHRSETKEIRLYGLKGKDEFQITGKTRKGITIRVIGGEGVDEIVDSSFVAEGNKKTKLYDTKKSNRVYFYKETADLRSDKEKDSVHVYRHNFQYNYAGPILYPEYNVDDGLFIGVGFTTRRYGFRKEPYAKFNKVGINFSTETGAFNFKYYGDFREIYRDWSLSIDAHMLGPKYVINYFGFGNEGTAIKENIDYYRVKAQDILLSPLLYQEVRKNFLIGFGPFYQYTRIKNSPDRFTDSPESELDPQVFADNHFTGLKIFASLSNIRNLLYPTNGYIWNAQLRGLQQMNASKKFLGYNSDISFYWTPKFLLKSITLATRVGGGTNFGSFYFFQANTLGGTTNLRGYRRTRFYGRSNFYHNTELRIKLASFRTYVFPVKLGLIAFYDYGRVWADQESSGKWHAGSGPGLWVEIFNRFIFSGTYGISEEAARINVQLGFLF